jgi:hypothetical protein
VPLNHEFSADISDNLSIATNIETDDLSFIEKELLSEVSAVDAILNSNALVWLEIRKSLNILKSKNRKFYQTINQRLFLDFREIYINQLPHKRLYPRLDRALALAIKLHNRCIKQARHKQRQVELHIA